MRVYLHGDGDAGAFAEMLINFGYGKSQYCSTVRYGQCHKTRKFCYTSG